MDNRGSVWEKLDSLVYLAVKDLQHLAATWTLLLIIAIVGTQIMAIPERVTRSSMESAQTALSTAATEFNATQARLNTESGWYKPGSGYVDDLPALLSQALAELKSGVDVFSKAQSESYDPDTRWRDAGDAQNHVQTVRDKLKQVNDKLTAIAQQRSTARTQLQQASSAWNAAKENVDAVDARLKRETGQYLTKYVGPLNQQLRQAQGQIASAEDALAAARNALPADNTKGTGDPVAAMAKLAQIAGNTSQATTLVSQMGDRLTYLATASNGAAPTTAQALTLHDQTVGYVNGLAGEYRFWFKGPYATLNQAQVLYQQAQAALDTPTAEGKKDLPAAYEFAGQSIAQSTAAHGAADGEVADSKAAASAIARIDSRIAQVSGVIGSAGSSESTLSSYHASSTWSDVSGNINQSRSLVNAAQTRKANAQRLISLDVQQFADGRREAEGGLSGLDQAQSLAQAVISKADSLESVRGRWPSAQSAAASAISGSSSNISSYGSYDSGAESDYNSAVSLLNQARSNASGGYYENAVSQANRAASLANGAGDRAYSSYLAYKRAQEEEARRQAAEAQAAAERARQAAEDAARRASSSTSSGSGSSYSSGSGGGYSSGSGHSSGGSDSNWGGSSGGSDSDWK